MSRSTSRRKKLKTNKNYFWFERRVLGDQAMLMSILNFVGIVSLANCNNVNKHWNKSSDKIINQFFRNTFALESHNKHVLMQLKTSLQLDNSWTRKKRVSDKLALKQLTTNKNVIDALESTYNLSVLLIKLVKEHNDNTFVAIEVALDILKKCLRKDSHDFTIWDLSHPDISEIISARAMSIDNAVGCYNYVSVNIDTGRYYNILLEKQILGAIFDAKPMEKYVPKNGRNLLLLDFSHTLCVERSEENMDNDDIDSDNNNKNNARYVYSYQSKCFNYDKNTFMCKYQYIPRDGLNDFLIFVCKYFNVWIVTGAMSRKEIIMDLNKIDGINIYGVIWNCLYKERFTKYISENGHWFNLDFKCTDFLLIDDEKIYEKLGVNTIRVPKFTWNRGEDQRQKIKHDPIDTKVFDKLKSWLKQWNNFTNLNRVGTTKQFIQHHGKPKFVFTQLDN